MEELSGALLPFECAFILARGCEWQIQEGSFLRKKGLFNDATGEGIVSAWAASIFRD